MNNFKYIIFILSVLLLFSSSAFAKKQPMKTYYVSGSENVQTSTSAASQHTKNKFESNEKITKEQKEKIDDILLQEKGKISALERNMDKAKKELHTELLKEIMNLTTIENLKNELLTTASDIEKIYFETECKIRNLLSPNQYYQIYKKIQKSRK